MTWKFALAFLLSAAASSAAQAEDRYTIDPNHTYPSVEVDHMGLSFWRGKFNNSSGTITLDRHAKTGTVDIIIDLSSVDFGHEQLNEQVKSAEIFNVDQFPIAHYHGTVIKFNGDKPMTIDGELNLHGVSHPVTLTINKFTCIQHPVLQREVCGADASATFNRTDFGINFGVPRYAPQVKLAIQVEAIKN